MTPQPDSHDTPPPVHRRTGLPCPHPADLRCSGCATDAELAAALPQCGEEW